MRHALKSDGAVETRAGPGSYATDQSPIVKALSRMDASVKERILRMFEITYTVVKESIAFVKLFVTLKKQMEWSWGKGTTMLSLVLLVTFIAEY